MGTLTDYNNPKHHGGIPNCEGGESESQVHTRLRKLGLVLMSHVWMNTRVASKTESYEIIKMVCPSLRQGDYVVDVEINNTSAVSTPITIPS